MPAKLTGILPLLLLLFACANNQSDQPAMQGDSNVVTNDSAVHQPTDTGVKEQGVLSFAKDSILPLLAAGQYAKLASFISDDGIVFSPYGQADTEKNKVLTRQQFVELIKTNKAFLWGYADATGDAIRLTVPQYFTKFVYDVDFLKAEQTSENKVIDPDSAISKVPLVYAHDRFAEFYFPGFKKEYEGMDWKSLILVFKKQQSAYYLTAVIHNQYKI